jgi:hypothetical protein
MARIFAFSIDTQGRAWPTAERFHISQHNVEGRLSVGPIALTTKARFVGSGMIASKIWSSETPVLVDTEFWTFREYPGTSGNVWETSRFAGL